MEKIADAVLLAWYPGEEGGNAVADILFGDANPAGRLPVTFYRSTTDLPPFEDYSMKERTYRYFTGKPTHPFGFGLSYTSFSYSLISATEDPYRFKIKITNTGKMDGDEVVQLYLRKLDDPNRPMKELKKYEKVSIKKGMSRTIELGLSADDMEYWNEKTKKYEISSGEYEVMIGSSSEDIRLRHRFTIQ